MGIVVIVLVWLPAVTFLGALLYAALFQRDEIAFYRDIPVGGNPSEWSRYTNSGERW